MFGFQFVERAAQRVGLIQADTFDEVHQSGPAVTGVGGLIQGLDHQPGDQFVTAADRCVAVRAVIPDLRYQVLLASRCRTVITVV